MNNPQSSLELHPFLESVLNSVTPDEDVWAIINPFIAAIKDELSRLSINADLQVGGSIAKGTWLKGDFDCDLFIKFDYSYKDDDISQLLEHILEPFNVTRVHGSRDYFQVTREDMNFEIIPVLSIESPEAALNITDVSPLHVAWVKQFDMNQEIRLSKCFCKAQGVYGAESYIGGFSGHVLDILTIYYGGFVKLLEATQQWKFKELIDVNNVHKGSLAALNESKIAALNVIDPIQPERNAAAALSQEKVALLKKAALNFLDHPSASFFTKVPFDITQVVGKYEGSTIIVAHLGPTEGKRDIVGAKLMKCHEYICTQLRIYGFEVIAHGWNWEPNDPATLWFVFDPEPLPDLHEKKGPPLKSKVHTEKFKEKNPGAYERDGFLYAQVKNKYTLPLECISDLSQDVYVSQKTSSAHVEKM